MFVPGVRQGFHVPPSFTPFVLGVAAVSTALLAWALLEGGSTSNESEYSAVSAADPSTLRSVAYTRPENGQDLVLVRPEATGSPRVLASFPYAPGLHARGAASPRGDALAVLHVGDSPAAARLTFVTLGGLQRSAEGQFDYLSALAWSRTVDRVAAVRTSTSSEGAKQTSVVEVSLASGASAPVANFEGASQVVPVGYSLDGARLFIVVVDQSGSNLWSREEGRVERIATLSQGPTRDWALSPDGSRLAYVERLGVGERTYAGRTLVLATGTVTDYAPLGDQLGSSWRPGSDVPDFGGPGGSVQLTDHREGDYLIPLQWAPDGSALVAATYSVSRQEFADSSQSIEIVSTKGWRVPLALEPGARFLGFTRDLP